MLGEMTQRGLVPDVVCYNEIIKAVTFNALMHGLCKAGKLEEAHLLLYKMEIGRSPSLFFWLSQGSDQVLDTVSLQKKVEQMCEAGQLVDAYKLLTQVACSRVMPDIVTYNVLINGFCKAANINGALKFFKDMQNKGFSPNSVTYGTLIDGLFRIGREEDAFKIREHMLKHGCEPSFEVYRALMTWLCRKRKVSQAFRLYLEYLKNLRGREDDSINALEQCFVRGKVEQAFQGLLELDFRLRDFALAPYTILLIGFCQAEKVDEASVIFSVLDKFNININPTSCVFLIRGLSEKGRLDDAVNIFLYTLDRCFKLKSSVCEQLLNHLNLSQDKKECAIDLVHRMKSAGYLLNSLFSQNTLCTEQDKQ
ncbi:Pentatricopeptide repeat-containing protein [Glycine soja]